MWAEEKAFVTRPEEGKSEVCPLSKVLYYYFIGGSQ